MTSIIAQAGNGLLTPNSRISFYIRVTKMMKEQKMIDKLKKLACNPVPIAAAGLLILAFVAFVWEASLQPSPPQPATDHHPEGYAVIYRDRIIVESPLDPPPPQDSELECMAMNIYYEARNQSRLGQIAVGQVVLNRIQHTYYPDTVCEVVQQGSLTTGDIYRWITRDGEAVRIPSCQFSWYCDGQSDEIRDRETNQAWRTAVDIATAMLTDNPYEGMLEGATHYHATYVDPAWASTKTEVTQIDSHIFYRWD